MEKIELETVVPKELENKRLDLVLSKLFPKYSRSKIQSWIKAGEVAVNDLNYKQRDTVNYGDVIKINTTLRSIVTDQAESIELNIIYEDNEIIVINKQAGLVVHPGAGNPSHTLVNALLNFDKKLKNLPRAGIIHRLDKDTTGIMVIARTIESHAFLVEELQKRNIKRNYRAIICGQLVAGGKIENRIGRHPTYRTKMAVNNKGKLATTHYKIIKKYQHYTYLDIQLGTGRTHQIRVHMNSIKHPIIGDPLYGKNTFIRKGICASLREDIKSFRRQALHAHNLEFIHPSKKKIVSYKAELPDDMKTLIKTLEIND
jgi:23S rRNA pseudouridine1911/1915/1917 synthase|tara:strand:+ start:2008 stop:2952 length:945 start_codon:yes stop_codon:yes gene_type:complete